MKALGAGVAIMLCPMVALTAAPRRPGQPEIQISTLERRISDLINKERVERQLTALVVDGRLAKIARAHSFDMGTRNFFSHTNPDGRDATARGKLAGYTCRKPISSNSFREGLGENLYQDNLYSRIHIDGGAKSYDWNTPEEIAINSIRGWMNSPSHRRNILEMNYSQTGIGIAVSDDDKVFVTQLFC